MGTDLLFGDRLLRLQNIPARPDLAARAEPERDGAVGVWGVWQIVTIWKPSHRADKEVLPLADRHYNRQKPGSPQFVPPGRCVVLKTDGAVWVTSWPFAEYVRHQWAGAWVNSIFRRESGEELASEMIRQAVAVTRSIWDAPSLGIVSFIDPLEVKPRKVRGRPCIAESYFAAGWKHVGYTKSGLWTMQQLPHEMPDPMELPQLQEFLSFDE